MREACKEARQMLLDALQSDILLWVNTADEAAPQAHMVKIHRAVLSLVDTKGRNRSPMIGTIIAKFLRRVGVTVREHYVHLYRGVVRAASGRTDDRGCRGCHIDPMLCQICIQ